MNCSLYMKTKLKEKFSHNQAETKTKEKTKKNSYGKMRSESIESNNRRSEWFDCVRAHE